MNDEQQVENFATPSSVRDGQGVADGNPADVYMTAAEWHSRLGDPGISPITRAQFDDWLAASSRHADAYRAVETMWSHMGEGSVDPRIMALRREALGASKRAWIPRAAAAAALVAIVAGAAYLALPSLWNPQLPHASFLAAPKAGEGVFKTAVGEQSTVMLSDGSSVALNTDSHIDVDFTSRERRVRLLNGQAWFQVAKNPQRPFIVEAAKQRITAVGTAFDVRLGGREESVQVTLLEGRVTVEPIRSPLARLIKPQGVPAQLAAGESFVVSATTLATKQRADVAKISSWRQGQIVFDDDTLGSAVDEINRYSTTKIVLAEPALSTLRVSGVFKAGHSQSFVETVTGHYPIEVVERTERRVVLAAKP